MTERHRLTKGNMNNFLIPTALSLNNRGYIALQQRAFYLGIYCIFRFAGGRRYTLYPVERLYSVEICSKRHSNRKLVSVLRSLLRRDFQGALSRPPAKYVLRLCGRIQRKWIISLAGETVDIRRHGASSESSLNYRSLGENYSFACCSFEESLLFFPVAFILRGISWRIAMCLMAAGIAVPQSVYWTQEHCYFGPELHGGVLPFFTFLFPPMAKRLMVFPKRFAESWLFAASGGRAYWNEDTKNAARSIDELEIRKRKPKSLHLEMHLVSTFFVANVIWPTIQQSFEKKEHKYTVFPCFISFHNYTFLPCFLSNTVCSDLSLVLCLCWKNLRLCYFDFWLFLRWLRTAFARPLMSYGSNR